MRSHYLSLCLFLGVSAVFSISSYAYALNFLDYSVGDKVYKKDGAIGDHDELVILKIEGNRAYVRNVDKNNATEWVSGEKVISYMDRMSKNYDDVSDIYDAGKKLWDMFGGSSSNNSAAK